MMSHLSAKQLNNIESHDSWLRLWRVCLDEDDARYTCGKCGFETNSSDIFELHKKDCPRV